MARAYTARYTQTESGYMGQLVEWPEVVTEGRTIEECKAMLQDAVHEMLLAYQEQGLEPPVGGSILQQILVEA